MSSETRDPRVDMLRDWQRRTQLKTPFTPDALNTLARLDAADPLRALLPEVVEVLERMTAHMDEGVQTDYDPETGDEWPSDDWSDQAVRTVREANRLLTRLQALTTEEPTDG